MMRTDGGAVAVLFRASGAGATFVAAATTAWFLASRRFASPRDVAVLKLLRRQFEERGLHPLSFLPADAMRSFDLARASEVFLFASFVLLAVLASTWIAAAAVAPAIALLHRVSTDRGASVWTVAYPLAALVAPLAPVLLELALARGFYGRAARLAVVVATMAVVWLALLAVLRRADRVAAFAKRAGAAAAVLAALTLGGGTLGAVARLGGRDSSLPAARGRPNVLLVSIDSLRPDHLHCYGYPRPTSPTIDRLAAEGALFRTVVSPTTWTLPSHLTLLSGLAPERHGVVTDYQRLDAEAPMLADVLAREGYATAGFVGGPYLDGAYGFARGFEHYDDYSVVKAAHADSHSGVSSPRLVELVRGWLEEWRAEEPRRPFFVFLHLWDVHYHWKPPPPYDRLFDADYRGSISGDPARDLEILRRGDERDLARLIALYDGEIAFTDEHLGRLVDALGGLGVLDDTLVIVTSDHGDEFLEHGQLGHRHNLYDETLLVPLVVRHPPRVAKGAVVDEQVRLMDVPVTILALTETRAPLELGAPGPHAHAPRDLSPLLGGRKPDGEKPPAAFSDLEGRLASVRTAEWKLISEPNAPVASELYDLVRDPAEKRNLVSTQGSAAQALAAELGAWRTAAAAHGAFSDSIELSAEQEERLRALGYLE
jgi:arylsulfatase A-like enzyme